MTHSAEVRRADAFSLLNALFSLLGERALDCTPFNPEEGELHQFQRTSWDELVAEALLTSYSEKLYFFTAKGWSEAFYRFGDVEDYKVKQNLGTLCQTLKSYIEGRSAPTVIPFDLIVSETQLPPGMIFNFIDSHLICRMFGRKDASWMAGCRGRVVEIPRNFGHNEIDLFADLRQQNQNLSDQLERMESFKSHYRCSYCSAPLAAIASYEHEYGSDEVTEYACGMTIGAPYGDVPCTKDPSFPKFDDYEVTTTNLKDGWWCFAHAKEPHSKAALVHLFQTHGKSEQQAREAMKERFLRRATPWRG